MLSCSQSSSSNFFENLFEIFNTRNCITVFEDNQGTIKVVQTLETKKSKHFDVKFDFVKVLVSKRSVKLIYVQYHDQLGDIMTKTLPLLNLFIFVKKGTWQMCDIFVELGEY